VLYNFASGKRVVVKFASAGSIVKSGPYRGRTRVKTTCYIRDITDPVTTDLIGFGKSYQNPADVNIKFLGRKLALTRALELVGSILSKEERRAIWADFLKTGLVLTA
jgi:hypothetical protein